jgi:hypothetical protein
MASWSVQRFDRDDALRRRRRRCRQREGEEARAVGNMRHRQRRPQPVGDIGAQACRRLMPRHEAEPRARCLQRVGTGAGHVERGPPTQRQRSLDLDPPPLRDAGAVDQRRRRAGDVGDQVVRIEKEQRCRNPCAACECPLDPDLGRDGAFGLQARVADEGEEARVVPEPLVDRRRTEPVRDSGPHDRRRIGPPGDGEAARGEGAEGRVVIDPRGNRHVKVGPRGPDRLHEAAGQPGGRAAAGDVGVGRALLEGLDAVEQRQGGRNGGLAPPGKAQPRAAKAVDHTACVEHPPDKEGRCFDRAPRRARSHLGEDAHAALPVVLAVGLVGRREPAVEILRHVLREA